MKIPTWIKENKLLILILVIGAVLRFYKIDFQSVWLDEIHTLNEANPNLSWSEFYNALLIAEPHPPLYFAIVRLLFVIFGYSTLVLRLFSSIIGIVSIYAMYLLGKEMHSKKVGLFSAFILSFNYFHLYYSQEGRPYIFLVLFTIISFYRLMIFVKNPTKTNAIFYGVFSALMIYGHFFGLFALVAQYMILMFFLIITKKESKIKYLLNLIISGSITLFLYIPAIKLFIAASKIKSFWIPAPTIDAYTIIFKDFFGNSEMIIGLIGILIFFYFVRLSKEKDFEITYESIIQNKTILNFFILSFWIVIVLLIPLIRSYISIPMLINRYFIVLLPAIILIISLGLNEFKNKFVIGGVLTLFFVFFVTDVFVVKKLFNNPLKSQFREATNFIKNNNRNNTPVVSSLGWYLPFFIKNGKDNYEIIDKPLENYLNEMQQDSSKIKPFWYFDAHGRPYKVSENTQNFLDNNFEIEENMDLWDAWAKHYVIIGTKKSIINNENKQEFYKTRGDSIKFGIDDFKINSDKIYLNGWASLEKQSSTNSKINLILKSDKNEIITLNFKSVTRNDVTIAFNKEFNLDNSGFNSITDCSSLPKGKYQLGVFITDKSTQKEGFVLTDKFISK